MKFYKEICDVCVIYFNYVFRSVLYILIVMYLDQKYVMYVLYSLIMYLDLC